MSKSQYESASVEAIMNGYDNTGGILEVLQNLDIPNVTEEKEARKGMMETNYDGISLNVSNEVDSSNMIGDTEKDNQESHLSGNVVNNTEQESNSQMEGFKSNTSTSTDQTDEKKNGNHRKNIRDVMDENQLDTTTLAAQREESERLARVAEQQKILREYQRQAVVNRQFVRTQNRVLSLLQNANAFAKVTDLTRESVSNEDDVSYHPVEKKSTSTPLQSAQIEENKLNKDDVIEISPDTNTSASETGVELSETNDVVTIEDSSSEDDCILLSDDEEEEEEEDVEDDPNNSGLHVKDAYNIPDEHGRVVVNIGHPDEEEDIFVAPQIARTIKPHQIGGVRFLFDNIIESTKRFKSSSGFGCILAHSMGLGKTLQVVCFCDLFLRHTPSKSVLCVMPINTLQNWVAEFNMWTPRTSSDPDRVRPREFDIFVLNDQQKTLTARAKVITKWAEAGGVLLMGYELFRMLALKIAPTRRRRAKQYNNENDTDMNKRLLENIHQALVKPGPDLVICDEGHRIKNAHAGISLALKQIRTRRRIVLTGYPLQNNLLEYWCMVDFVRPNYLGTRTEFCNMFERPIQNGQCIDSTPEDIKLMRYRAHVLHSLLVGFVQRRSHLVLQQTLPQKLEYVILTRMTDFQRQLYDTFMNDVVRSKTVPNPLKAFAVCCKIWNHPDVLYNFLKKRETDIDLEIDENEPTVYPNASISTLKPPSELANSNETVTQTAHTSSGSGSNSSTGSSNTHSNNIIINNNNTNNNNSNSMERNGDHRVCGTANVSAEPINKTQMDDANGSDHMRDVIRKSYEKIYCTDEYYNQNNAGSFSSDFNGNMYGQEPSISLFGYQPTSSNIESSSKLDYVGMMVNKPPEKSRYVTENLSSSEIVDLDTKEIKTYETDINMNSNPILKTDLQKNENSVDSEDKAGSSSKLSQDNKTLNSGQIDKEGVKTKNDDSIPYEWALDIFKKYEPGLITNSPKMEIFFCILNQSIELNDRVLLFSQSLLTLNLIEQFLQSTRMPNGDMYWERNTSYFRLDGSTTSQEREKLVNEFNRNPNVKLFLISTKAGSLGINLIGANRVIVFDASWNPCHDTQAVYRIYRYGQEKACYVYRIVMDKCLEKKIYDRQIKKQGMSDRVVDECNPDAHLSMKDITNLCHDYDDENRNTDDCTEFAQPPESYMDPIVRKIVQFYKSRLSKEPFYHDSLLIDRKEKKLSQAEKRQAHRGYEMEKKASIKQTFTYSPSKMQYKIIRNDGTVAPKPTGPSNLKSGPMRSTRWIPAEVWQRQGMTAQEMTLPMDVVIPTNSNEKSNIILKAGQRVMVLKSSKGIYMQLESGKIIAIRTSSKMNETNKMDKTEIIDITSETDNFSNSTSKTDNTQKAATKSAHTDASNTQKNEIPHNLSENGSDDVSIVNEYPKSYSKTAITGQRSLPMVNNDLTSKNGIRGEIDRPKSHSPKQKANEMNINESHKRKKSKYSDNSSDDQYTLHTDRDSSSNQSAFNMTDTCESSKSNDMKQMQPNAVNSNTEIGKNNGENFFIARENEDKKNKLLTNSVLFNPEVPSNISDVRGSHLEGTSSRNLYGTDVKHDGKEMYTTYTGEKKHFPQERHHAPEKIDKHQERYMSQNQAHRLQHTMNSTDLTKITPYSIFSHQLQQQNHEPSQHKYPLYMSPFNIQHSHLNNSSSGHTNIQNNLSMDSNFLPNSYQNRDSNIPQYCDNYSNTNCPNTCDYSAQFADYHSYGSYNPSYHTFQQSAYTIDPTSVSSHSYWPPLVSPSPLIEQRNTNYPNYSQNISQSDQWHHQ